MGDPSIARSTRTYVLAMLLATVAATALIAMLFIIFCPTQVTFEVTHACRSNSSNDGTVSIHLSISISVANTSHQRRTKVKLESIFIDLFNSSDPLPLGREEEDDRRRRINAHVDDHEMPDGYLNPGNTTIIGVSAATPNHTFLDFAPDWLTDDVGQPLTVMVMAQVHFKIGVVRTRLYGITVYCNDVVFPNQRQPTTTATAPTASWSTAKNAAPPVSETVKSFPQVTCHS